MYSLKEIKAILKDSKTQTIIFPEGDELKIQQTAQMLVEENLVNVILLFNKKTDIPTNANPKIQMLSVDQIDTTPYINKFVEIRGEKTNLEQATKLMQLRTYIGTMMILEQKVDAMVCGLTFTTADTLRPALQVVKVKKGFSIASSAFIMKKDDQAFIFTDCALNVNPDAKQLAQIGIMATNFAKSMNVANPETVFLSYSTKGSGAGEAVDKVVGAIAELDNIKPDFIYDGEFQFDAAFVQEVRNKKAPNTKLKKATPDVFVFPELQSANIGYKIAQRFGGFDAVGPFILGLNKPINDLSRGATLEDIYETAIYTAFQALNA
ncbi:phosphate acetyltransferase [Williamsoniiplasma luminosum]|uniref:Phosphate acetyltransferase n=1 Tax=Williamsoniiplasma luminosum TaxID=214888 RepID=A0A2S0NK83_9MOLU|nr:phosphate acetyltransferase [Williamsoniiplasma luminosum]AVP49412.1 MAG: phosphate acetyltransferase [Williamsoniiplasma luminosum]